MKHKKVLEFTFTNPENLAHFWGFLDNFSDVVTAVGCEEVCDEDTQETKWALNVQPLKGCNELDIAIINDAFEDITVRQVEI